MRSEIPFHYSRPVGTKVTLFFVVVGFCLLLGGNAQSLSKLTFLGAEVGPILSNIGFSVLLLVVFQWIFDHKHRETFFRDIRNEIVADESIEQAGVVRIYADSKRIDYRQEIAKAATIEIGVTYSDRFFKDFFSQIVNNKRVKLVVVQVNDRDNDLVEAIAKACEQSKEAVLNHFKALAQILSDIQAQGVSVDVKRINSLPRYAFVRFDEKRTFLILSTFCKRRAAVPAFELRDGGDLKDFVSEDIKMGCA